jgi:hypothetical protein
MNYSCFYYLFSYPFIRPITNPAERPPTIGIPSDVASPIWLRLLKDDRIDVMIKFDDIVKIRNKITHTGLSSILDFNYQWRTYQDFMSILVRIFFAIIDYDFDYFDPWQGKWIKFKEKLKA